MLTKQLEMLAVLCRSRYYPEANRRRLKLLLLWLGFAFGRGAQRNRRQLPFDILKPLFDPDEQAVSGYLERLGVQTACIAPLLDLCQAYGSQGVDVFLGRSGLTALPTLSVEDIQVYYATCKPCSWPVELQEAVLRTLRLRQSSLHGVTLRSLDLSGINLADADLGQTCFSHVQFKQTNLSGSDLSCSQLRSVRLDYASLHSSQMRAADLRDAVLIRTDLRMADLRGADLRGADLRGAKLSGALLTQAHLDAPVRRWAQKSGAQF